MLRELYKQTSKRHFLCVFILQFFTTLHVSNDHFFHYQEFMIYSICSSVQTMQTCVPARSYGFKTVRPSSQTRLHGLYRAADTVNHELLIMKEMVVETCRVVKKNCRINTQRKCIFLFFYIIGCDALDIQRQMLLELSLFFFWDYRSSTFYLKLA